MTIIMSVVMAAASTVVVVMAAARAMTVTMIVTIMPAMIMPARGCGFGRAGGFCGAGAGRRGGGGSAHFFNQGKDCSHGHRASIPKPAA